MQKELSFCMHDDNGRGGAKKRRGDYLAWKERPVGLAIDWWWSYGRRRRHQLLDEREGEEGEGEARGGGAATAMEEEGQTISGEGEVWWR